MCCCLLLELQAFTELVCLSVLPSMRGCTSPLRALALQSLLHGISALPFPACVCMFCVSAALSISILSSAAGQCYVAGL